MLSLTIDQAPSCSDTSQAVLTRSLIALLPLLSAVAPDTCSSLTSTQHHGPDSSPGAGEGPASQMQRCMHAHIAHIDKDADPSLGPDEHWHLGSAGRLLSQSRDEYASPRDLPRCPEFSAAHRHHLRALKHCHPSA